MEADTYFRTQASQNSFVKFGSVVRATTVYFDNISDVQLRKKRSASGDRTRYAIFIVDMGGLIRSKVYTFQEDRATAFVDAVATMKAYVDRGAIPDSR
jgi:hypothetical protein